MERLHVALLARGYYAGDDDVQVRVEKGVGLLGPESGQRGLGRHAHTLRPRRALAECALMRLCAELDVWRGHGKGADGLPGGPGPACDGCVRDV